MNDQFKKWAIKNLDQMELEEKQKIFLMIRNDSREALAFIRGCIRDWFVLFSAETKASQDAKLDVSDDSVELLQVFQDYFDKKMAAATQ